MLQHASIDTFVRHYSVGIHVDAQAIVRGLPAQKELMRFACSMSRSIDPRRPYKLEDSSVVNQIPRVVALEELKHAREQARNVKKVAFEQALSALQREFGDDPPEISPASGHLRNIYRAWQSKIKILGHLRKRFERAEERYIRSVRDLRNEKGRQRNRLIRENLERYKNEQPVIDSERQLSGKIVDEDVMGALERTGYMTPQHMTLIDTVLTMPEDSVEKEYHRRIAAINAVIAVCDAEEGTPSRPCGARKRTAETVDIPLSDPLLKKQKPATPDKSDDTFVQAIASVCIKSPKQRPTICFLCLGNTRLPDHERLENYKNSGSLSRHFVNIHVKPFPKDMRCECSICCEKLDSKSGLLNHAERVHGTVSRLSQAALGLR